MKVEIVKNKNLSKKYKDLINENRIREFGSKNKKDFRKDYEPETLWFFVKDGNMVVSLGGLRPLKIKYLGKEYEIGGICSIISVIKGKGYGKLVIQSIIKILKKTRKTGLGFCGRQNIKFYEKSGLKIKLNFIKKIIFRDPKTGEEIIDNDGDGLYYEGKDKLISKTLKGKAKAYIEVLHW